MGCRWLGPPYRRPRSPHARSRLPPCAPLACCGPCRKRRDRRDRRLTLGRGLPSLPPCRWPARRCALASLVPAFDPLPCARSARSRRRHALASAVPAPGSLLRARPACAAIV